jgi:hypothetical protein
MSIGAAILGADGVETIANLKINDGKDDIILGEEQIPILHRSSWTVT